MHHTIIPVFHELQITSTYEYLQTRFDRKVRLFGSLMFTLATTLWSECFCFCMRRLEFINYFRYSADSNLRPRISI
jgi:uncharacterized sodium:solute symporter family permease YidK